MRTQLIIILTTLTILKFSAQDPYHIVYGIDDGLPSEEVYDVYVDKDDIVWVTTDRGVSRYNGYEFKNYDTSDGLAYNTNFKIFPDNFGRLWFLGLDESISIYENGQFRSSEYSHRIEGNLKNDFIYLYGLGFDANNDFYVHYSGKSSQTEINTFYKLLGDNSIEEISFSEECFAETEDGSLCISKVDFENTSFIYIPQKENISSSVVKMGENSGVLLIPISYMDKATKYKNGSKVFQLYSYANGRMHPILSNNDHLNTVSKDNFGNIIVCSPDGIYLYRDGDMFSEPEKYFEGLGFSDVYQDRNNNYWFSSEKNGLYFVPTFDNKVIEQRGSQKSIKQIVFFDNKLFYYYGYNNIDYLDKHNEVFRLEENVSVENSIQKKLANTILTLSDKNGKYFLPYDESPRKIFLSEEELPNGDTLNVSTRNFSIRRKGKTVFDLKDFLGVTNKYVQDFTVRDSTIWFSTLRHLFKITNLEYENIQKVMDKDSLLNVRINEFKFDSNDYLWLATIGNGLLLYKDSSVVQFDVSDGLSSNQINTLHFENDTSLWLGSNTGIDWIQFTSDSGKRIKSINSFSTKDGLLSNYINMLHVWNDKMLVGSQAGLQMFNYKNAVTDITPTLEIKEMMIGDKYQDFEEDLILNHDQNDITFFYEGVSYNKPKDRFYKFKIERQGEKLSWNYTNNRSVVFQNLDAGQYVFSVSARNKNQKWTDIKSYSFSINPHFTSTWWFWFLCIVSLAALSFYLYFKRLQYLINKDNHRRVLEDATLRAEIAELSTFRNQFNPHFIFNSLNSIQNYIFKKDIRLANRYLSKFSKLIRESLNLTEKKFVTIEKELAFIQSYLEIEFLRFPDKFSFKFHNKDDVPTNYYYLPPLLLQPVIENVVKHAFKGKDTGNLDISVDEDATENGILITIEDDGTGMEIKDHDQQENNSNSRRSFGMKIVHERIKLLNMNYPFVDSYFEIKNKPESSGTIAKFKIPKITLELI